MHPRLFAYVGILEGHQNVRQASVPWLMSRSGAMWQRSVPTPISPSL